MFSPGSQPQINGRHLFVSQHVRVLFGVVSGCKVVFEHGQRYMFVRFIEDMHTLASPHGPWAICKCTGVMKWPDIANHAGDQGVWPFQKLEITRHHSSRLPVASVSSFHSTGFHLRKCLLSIFLLCTFVFRGNGRVDTIQHHKNGKAKVSPDGTA